MNRISPFTPNVAFFLQALGNGFTFGEAAWASQPALSWQTTVIGDPLYRPFGKSPQAAARRTCRARTVRSIEWSYLRLVNLGLVRGARMAEVAGLLENLDATTNSAVLTEKLADLYEAQGKPSSAILTWQKRAEIESVAGTTHPPPAHARRKTSGAGPRRRGG